MNQGSVTKLVRSFGSKWGRVRVYGQAQDVFFNPESLDRPEEFDVLTEGQAVEFDQESDRANGTRAVRLVLSTSTGSPAAAGHEA